MQHLTRMIKALSEEIRLRIIALLSGGELCVCDLMAVLNLPQSTISRHLSYLKNAGWVKAERRGVWMNYRLGEQPAQAELLQALTALLVEEDRIGDDLEKLTLYLQTKKHDACL